MRTAYVRTPVWSVLHDPALDGAAQPTQPRTSLTCSHNGFRSYPPAKDYPILLTREQGFGMQVGATGCPTKSRLCAGSKLEHTGRGLDQSREVEGVPSGVFAGRTVGLLFGLDHGVVLST